MPRMYLPPAPTRHEVLHALWFPLVMAPILLVYVRYRMLTWDVASANLRDGVDYSSEAWQLSGYVSVLFVLFAYPVMLSEYDAWLWTFHANLTLALIAFWISFCAWVGMLYFEFQRRADKKLLQDLGAISQGTPPVPAAVTPHWLRLWGWGNGVVSVLLLVGIARLLAALR